MYNYRRLYQKAQPHVGTSEWGNEQMNQWMKWLDEMNHKSMDMQVLLSYSHSCPICIHTYIVKHPHIVCGVGQCVWFCLRLLRSPIFEFDQEFVNIFRTFKCSALSTQTTYRHITIFTAILDLIEWHLFSLGQRLDLICASVGAFVVQLTIF